MAHIYDVLNLLFRLIITAKIIDKDLTDLKDEIERQVIETIETGISGTRVIHEKTDPS